MLYTPYVSFISHAAKISTMLFIGIIQNSDSRFNVSKLLPNTKQQGQHCIRLNKNVKADKNLSDLG